MGTTDIFHRLRSLSGAFSGRKDAGVSPRRRHVFRAGADLRGDAAEGRARAINPRYEDENEPGFLSGWNADRLRNGGTLGNMDGGGARRRVQAHDGQFVFTDMD